MGHKYEESTRTHPEDRTAITNYTPQLLKALFVIEPALPGILNQATAVM
jgi:hypothetical protein